jgi:hypothetical protein
VHSLTLTIAALYVTQGEFDALYEAFRMASDESAEGIDFHAFSEQLTAFTMIQREQSANKLNASFRNFRRRRDSNAPSAVLTEVARQDEASVAASATSVKETKKEGSAEVPPAAPPAAAQADPSPVTPAEPTADGSSDGTRGGTESPVRRKDRSSKDVVQAEKEGAKEKEIAKAQEVRIWEGTRRLPSQHPTFPSPLSMGPPHLDNVAGGPLAAEEQVDQACCGHSARQ